MKIDYFSALISNDLLNNLYKKDKPGLQAQVFNGLVVDGLIKNNVDVTCFSNIPISKELIDETFMKINDELNFKYFKIINVPIIKDIYILIKSYFNTKKRLKKYRNLSCVCDVLSVTNSLGATLACKALNRKCIGIVTDIPELFEINKLFIKLSNYVIRNCSGYVFLTEHMNDRLNIDNKPYVVIEGMCNFTLTNQSIKRSHVIMYAGSIDKVNGIDILVNAFKDIKTNYELHIYGTGDYEKELHEICKTHKNIKYFGLIEHNKIKDLIQTVSFLINPRNTTNEMVKYSFPSKNMEYLASGTPFLCTKLPCIPSEYFEYLNLFETDDVNGIREGIEKALNENYDSLLYKASKGQHFVLENKNNVSQTKKILSLIEEEK